jgi:hypothetical protein
MELRCLNEECDSEFFTPDDGETIFNSDGEIVGYSSRGGDPEPWIKEVYDDCILLEWVSIIDDEEEQDTGGESHEEIIPMESFRCLECGSEVEFIV